MIRSSHLIVLFSSALFATPADAQSLPERHYRVFLGGKEVGEQSMSYRGAGEIEIDFRFDDRGRGPDTRTQMRLDELGMPESLEITGVDYMKADVAETFERTSAGARWTSSVDSGHAQRAGFYLPLDAPPAVSGILAQSALETGNGRLALLPTGELRAETVGTMDTTAGTLRQVELHGLEFEPVTVWLDADGRFDAYIDSWLTVIPDDQTGLVEMLRERQDKRRSKRFAAMAEQLRASATSPVLIDNARILDVRRAAVRRENAVLIEGGRIVKLLNPADERPTGVRVVDAAGQTLMPGLWDMHVHLDLMHGPLNIAAGVTTVRDMANDHDNLTRIIEQFDTGSAIGPSVFRAGIIDGPGQFAGPTKALVATRAEAARWVDFYASHGYQQVKIYSSVEPELVPFIIERAHARGLRVSGHIPAGMWAEDAVRAGYDEIQHINMIFLNFYKDVIETRNRDRFIRVAERGADLDLEGEPYKAFVRLLRKHNTVIDPTVSVSFDMFTQQAGQPAPSIAADHARLPAIIARGTLKGGLTPPRGQAQRYRDSAQHMLDAVRNLHDAGIPLVAGTDALPGFALHSELEFYVQAGIAPIEVLRIATLGAAAVMGVDREVGAIEPGMRADLILVDGEPDRDIRSIRRVTWVMKHGDSYDPAGIYRAIGVVPVTAADAS